MGKHDLTIFSYSTILTLTRNGISTFAELEAMSNEQIAHLRGMGRRGEPIFCPPVCGGG